MSRAISPWALASLTIGLLVFTYIIVRAVTVGITYDEAWTIKVFIPASYWDIISYDFPNANNHILNTILVKLFQSVGGDSTFVARLPNVLSFGLYAFSAHRIANRHLRSSLAFVCFVLLLANPFLLDFFSLARGYGLALAFQAVSMTCLTAYAAERKQKHATWAFVMAGLAVLAGFATLNFFVAIVLTANLLAIGHKQSFTKTVISSLTVSILLGAIIYEPIRKLRQDGKLYYGGDEGFYQDTLMSLTKWSLYGDASNAAVLICLNGFLILLAAAVIASSLNDKSQFSVKNSLLAVLALSTLSVVAQHLLLGNLYLIDRTALLFYPLFICCLCFALNGLKSYRLAVLGGCITACVFCVNFLIHANGYKTALWFFDAHSEKLLARLEERGNQQNKQLSVGISWPFQGAIEYYLTRKKYPHLLRVDRAVPPTEADYYIYLGQPLEKVDYKPAEEHVLRYARDTVLQYTDESVFVFGNIREIPAQQTTIGNNSSSQ